MRGLAEHVEGLAAEQRRADRWARLGRLVGPIIGDQEGTLTGAMLAHLTDRGASTVLLARVAHGAQAAAAGRPAPQPADHLAGGRPTSVEGREGSRNDDRPAEGPAMCTCGHPEGLHGLNPAVCIAPRCACTRYARIAARG